MLILNNVKQFTSDPLLKHHVHNILLKNLKEFLSNIHRVVKSIKKTIINLRRFQFKSKSLMEQRSFKLIKLLIEIYPK